MNESDEPLDLTISRNHIKKCMGDAIVIKTFKNFNKVIIKHNEITETKGNGITLLSLEQRVNNVEVRDNKVDYNKGNGIFICDAVCEVVDCYCTHNASKGICIAKGKTNKLTTVIKNCTVRSNLGSGIGLATGNIRLIINSCKILKNKEYGLELDSTELEGNSFNFSGRSVDTSCFAVRDKKKTVVVRYGEISDNIKGGVYLDLKCNVLIYEVTIKNNGDAAVFMENNKGTIEYSEKTLKRKMIQGVVKKKHKEMNIYSRKKNKACGVCTVL
jgi:hypothetical protein